MQHPTPDTPSREPAEDAPTELSPRDVALKNIVMMTGLGRYDDVRQLLADSHPADIAELLDHLDQPGVRQRVFRLLPPEPASAVLSLVSPAVRDEVVTVLSDRELAGLVEELDTDDAADLLGTLPEERTPAVLAEMPSELAEDIGDLLDHPSDTAGGIMQTEYVSVPQYATVEQAIGLIRRAHDDVPEVHDVFVVNVERHVTGILPLSYLVLASPDEAVADIMDRPVISVPLEMPQDEVARILQKYDFVSVPVVDGQERLVGRVTIDDVVDVIEEEASKDIYAIAGVESESINLTHDSVLKRVGERFSWVVTTVLLGLVVALVISKVFVATFEKMALLAAFLPVIIATAGGRRPPVVHPGGAGHRPGHPVLPAHSVRHRSRSRHRPGPGRKLRPHRRRRQLPHQHGHSGHPQPVRRRPHRHGHLCHRRRLHRDRATHHLLQAQPRPRRRRRSAGDSLQRPAGHHAVPGGGDGDTGVGGPPSPIASPRTGGDDTGKRRFRPGTRKRRSFTANSSMAVSEPIDRSANTVPIPPLK